MRAKFARKKMVAKLPSKADWSDKCGTALFFQTGVRAGNINGQWKAGQPDTLNFDAEIWFKCCEDQNVETASL